MEDRVLYTKPEVVDYGSLVELTADIEHLNLSAGMLQAVVGAAVISQPLIPGDGGGVLATQGTGGTGTVPDAGGGLPGDGGGTLDEPAAGGGQGGGGGGAGAGGGGAAGGAAAAGGRLPFTGFSVFLVVVLGAGMAAGGASLRARLRRAR